MVSPRAVGNGHLEAQMRNGLLWSLLNTLVVRTGTLVTGIVIARVLSRADFGEFAVALVVLSVTLSLNELGTSTAIVRWPGRASEIAPTAATVSVCTSATLYAACFAAAPAIADALGAPSSTGVIRLLALAVLIDSVTAVPNAWLTRDFRQAAKFRIDTANFVVSTAVTLALALAGLGAWSLAWGRLAGNCVSALLLLRLLPHAFKMGLDRTVLPELLRFGLPLAASNLVVVAMTNADKAVTGNLLGPVQLGTYVLAFTLASWPVNVLSVTVQPVAIPGFARLAHDPAKLRQVLERGHATLLALTLLVSCPLAVLSDQVVRVLYGDKWAPAASVLSVLALAGVLRVMISLYYDVLVAGGRTGAALRVQFAWLATLVPAVYVGASRLGIVGVAWAQLVVLAIVVLPLTVRATASLGIRASSLVRASVRPVVAGIALIAALVVVRQLAGSDVSALLLSAPVGGVAYALVTGPMWRLPVMRLLRSRQVAGRGHPLASPSLREACDDMSAPASTGAGQRPSSPTDR